MRSVRLFAVVVLTCLLVMLVHAQAHSGLSLSAYTVTPPTIDGNMQAAEWAAASKATFGPFAVGVQTITGTLYMMNDPVNLYMAVSIEGDNDFNPGPGGDGFRAYFDNDHGGETSREQGDDDVIADGTLPIGDMYYNVPSVWDLWDNLAGGTSDGQSMGSRQGASNQFELSHPLDDTDNAHDFSLSIGQTVGFSLEVGVDGVMWSLSAYGFGSWNNPSTYANYLVSGAAPVGGVVVLVNTLALVAPWLAVIGLVGCIGTIAVVVKKHR